MTEPADPTRLRSAVQRTYARASAAASPAPSAHRGAKLAGYSDLDLSKIPEGVSFFGCGNPLSYSAVKPGETVLDLGSGAGFDLILAGERVGPSGNVIGVDMTPAMLERARANVARAGLTNVDVRQGLIENLPVADASVDWVISNCVISLSPEKERVFAEVARVLKPGGRMLISDIVVDDRLAWVLRRLTRIAPSIAMARTESAYLEAMARAGLTDARIVDRLVYDADQLVGAFGDDITRPPAGAERSEARPDAGQLTRARKIESRAPQARCELRGAKRASGVAPAEGQAGANDASSCPVAALGEQLKHGAIGKTAVRLAARTAAGHVWSAKFHAARPATV